MNDKRRAKGTPVSTFWSRTPAGAARKAGTSICRKSAKRGQCTLKLGIKETGKTKVYRYIVKRTVVNQTVYRYCTSIKQRLKGIDRRRD